MVTGAVDRRAQLLWAAAQVFAEKGFHHARVADIVQRAGVAQGTFYLYFPSKQAVLRALLAEFARRFLARHRQVQPHRAADLAAYQAQVAAFLTDLFQICWEHRGLAVVFFREGLAADPDLWAEYRAILQTFHQQIAANLRLASDRGLIRPVEPDLAATALLGMGQAVVCDHILTASSPPDLPRLAATVADLFFSGLRPTAEPSQGATACSG